MPGYTNPAYLPVSTSSHPGPPYPRSFWIRRLAGLSLLTAVVLAGLWISSSFTRDNNWLPSCPFASNVSSTFVDDGPTAAQSAQRLAGDKHDPRPLTSKILSETRQARAGGQMMFGQTQQVVPCGPNK
jgi:hypothetical protein